MDLRYKQLEQELSALGKVFGDLGARLSETAKEVTAPGVAPSEKLIEQISTARATFDHVRGAVHAHASSMLVNPLPKAAELLSIAAIETLLKATANAEENKLNIEAEREQALAILGRVLAIAHRETPDFKPLQECHAKVGELRDGIAKATWPQRSAESESITGLKHPSTALLSFVENLDTLEDDRWMALETTITEAYGKPLFVAASRGKLTCDAPAAKAAAKPAPAAEKPAEKKPAPVEKPVAAAPVAEKKAVQPAPAPVEKKEVAPQKPVPAPAVAPVAATPAPAAVEPVAAPSPTTQIPSAAATAAPAPAAVSVPAATSPAPVVAAAPVVPRPAAAPQAQANSIHSLTALATATEPPVTERKAVPIPPTDIAERQRKEPRLATPAQQPKVEPKPQDQEVGMVDDASRAVSGDGGQRTQRWGFWRGNR